MKTKLPPTKIPHLKTRRAQPLFPHRLLPPIAAMLLQLAELAEAIAIAIGDDRWNETSRALDAAASWVRSPYERRHRRDARRRAFVRNASERARRRR